LVAPFLHKNFEIVSENDENSPRDLMYNYTLQEAMLPQLWWDVRPEDDEMIVSFAIMKRVNSKPTFIVHSEGDTIVGVDEVIKALKEVNADVENERIPGLDHLFDEESKYQLENMYNFMYKHMH
jgi:dipeptidyl aminopeptidase/acylaminoacyl peptidase